MSRTVRGMNGEITLGRLRVKGWQLGLGAAAVAWLVFSKRAEASYGVVGTQIANATSRQDWAERLYFAMLNALPPLSDASKRIVIAHAALETGYPPYRKDSAARCNNIFNITTGSKWLTDGKPYCLGGDTTYADPLPDGSPRPITQKWRSYMNLEEALTDYWNFLGSRASLRAARDALIAGDPVAFSTRLREARYYDAPLDHYIAGITGAMRTAKTLLPTLA